jgi:hypothetical protein
MASKQFNSVDGYSVGSTPNSVIDANSNVSGNVITATANVTAPQLVSNVATGTAPITVTSTTRVANLNVAQANLADFISVAAGTGNNFLVFANAATGNITELTSTGLIANLSNNSITATTFVGSLSGAATSATTAGTVTTAAQPNITSVGTLSSLAVTANANVGNLNSAGRVIATDNLIVGSSGGEGGQLVLAYTGVSGITGQANSTWNMDVDSSNNFRLFSQNATGTVSAITMAAYSANNNVAFTGNVSANFFVGNGSQLTGITVSAGSSIVNGNSNVTVTANGNVTTSVAGTANVMVVSSNTVTAPIFAATNNGNGTNFRVGDDAWLGDVNEADTVRLMGQQDAANGYLVFGNSDNSAKLGRAGTGPLSYTGAMAASANITTPQFISNVATGTAPFVVTSTTRVANLNVNYANVADFISVAAGTGNNFLIFANAATGNITELTSTGLIANLSNNSITATTFVGALSGAATSATTAGTVTTAAQPNITSVSTSFTGLTFVANAQITMSGAGSQISGVNLVSANSFSGNGSSISALNATNISSGTLAQARLANSNVILGNTTLALGTTTTTVTGLSSVTSTTFVGALTGAATTAGTVTTAAQPNITSVGTLTSLGVSGTVTASAFTANTGIFTGNGSGLSAIAGANVTGTVSSATTATSATTAGTVTTAAQGNITSLGTLTGLGVNGTITAVNITANSGVFTGNGNGLSSIVGANVTGAVSFATTANAVAGANVSGAVAFATTANAVAGANVSGTVSAATTAGTVTTAAQPNITSVGTLTSVAVTGNVAAGNLTTTGVLSVTGTGVSSIAGNLDMTSNTIINLATPTNPSDAATKQYVDDVAQGLHTHDSCNAATNTTLAIISGGTVTYNNGASGVGANLTTTGTFTTIDGVTLSNGMRILVKDEANTAHNGIYDRTSTTVLTRSSDFDTPAEMAGGDFTFVTAGTLYDNTGWVMPDPVTTVGTSPVVWVQFSGAGTYTAGTGLTLTGSVFSVNASQTQVTSVGTLTGLGVNGTITAANITANTGIFTGNGSALTALNASNVSSGTLAQARLANSNVILGSTALTLGTTTTTIAGLSSVTSTTFVGALTGAATTAGTVTTAAQGNITSLGTLTGLGVNGTVTAVAFTANTGVFTGNGSGLSAIAGANVTGTVASATSAGSATTAGTVTTAAQGNITSLGTLTGLGVNGTITAVNITANSGVFTGNANGLSSLQAGNLTGTVAQARLANSNVILGSTTLTLGTTTTTIAGLSSVTSTTFVGALTGAATTAGTVTTAAQPNITSVGTLSALTVSGNTFLATSSGNVGIGTTTPAAKLDVATGINSLVQQWQGAGTNFNLRLTSGNGAIQDSTSYRIALDYLNGANTNGFIDFTRGTDGTSGYLTFGTAGAEKMRINASGNVGIGTTTPRGNLDVSTGTDATTQTRSIHLGYSGADFYGYRLTNVNNPGATAAGNFSIQRGNTTAWIDTVFINNDGNVGIGGVVTASSFIANGAVSTTSSGGLTLRMGLLASTPSNATDAFIGIQNTGGPGGLAGDIILIPRSSTGVDNAIRMFAGPTTPLERLTILSSGNVGIGTTSPGSILGVNGTVTAAAFTANTGVFTGNGAALTNLNASNVSSGTLAQARLANASVTLGSTALTLGSTVTTVAGLSSVTSTTFVGALTGAATTAATVTTAAQPNITSVGTLTSLNSSGTITAPAFTANTGLFTGNGAALTNLNASNISSGTLAQARLANASLTVNGTSIALGGSGTITATATGTLTIGSGLGGTSYNGSTGVTITNTGVTSIVAGTNIAVSGATGAVTVSVTGTVPTATTAATVTTAAQPNITSVGTLSALTVSGNAFLSTSSGNVGIGTSSPTSKIQLSYSNPVSVPAAGAGGHAIAAGAAGYGFTTGVLTSGTTYIQSTRWDGSAINYDLLLQPNGSNVGIGTTTPTVRLDVAGDIKVKSNIAYVSPNGANTINSTMLNGGTLAWSGNAGQLFSIADNMTGNIFTVNDVSGIPMISVDAGGNIQFAASGGFVNYGVTAGITAAGSTQGTATSLTRPINVVSTVSASTGVILPTVPAGARVIVMNTSGTALNVYPPSGAIINSAATNAAYSQPAGARLEFISVSATQWYTMNATYG